jgi:hypothetical protein
MISADISPKFFSKLFREFSSETSPKISKKISLRNFSKIFPKIVSTGNISSLGYLTSPRSENKNETFIARHYLYYMFV